MKNNRLATVLAASLGVGAVIAGAYKAKEIGSLHIGDAATIPKNLPAREIVFSPSSPPVKVNPNGEFEVGQMYARYVRLRAPTSPYPVLFWHGGGLTDVTWETKPDGAPGWEQRFLEQGFDTYVSDAVEPSGFPDPADTDLAPLRETPHLFAYGDHLAGPFWEEVARNARGYADTRSAKGAPGTFLDLRATGVCGNAYMITINNNSKEFTVKTVA